MSRRYIKSLITIFVILTIGVFLYQLRYKGSHPCFTTSDNIINTLDNINNLTIPNFGSDVINLNNSIDLSLIYQSDIIIPTDEIYFTRFNSTANWLALSYPGGRRIIDIATEETIWANGQSMFLPTFVFTPNNILLGLGRDGVLNVVDNSLIIDYRIRNNEIIRGSSVSPNGGCLAFGSSYAEVKFAVLGEDGTKFSTLNARNRVETVAFSQDGRWFAYGTAGGGSLIGMNFFSLWDLEQNNEVFALDTIVDVSNIAFNPHFSSVAVSYGNQVDIYDVDNRVLIGTLEHDQRDNYISELTYNHAGTILAVAYRDGTISLWNAMNNTRLADYNVASEIVNLAFTMDDHNLVVIDNIGRLGYWGIR